MNSMILTICGYVVCAFIGLLAARILWLIWTDKIDLSSLLCEANGDASMSRFQLMIFTFVIAVSLFYLVERNGFFPWISDGVLTLLGISASTYAVGKGISYSREEGVTSADERASVRATASAMSATGASSIVTPTGTASTGASSPPAND
jgi:hypothetical protein